MAFVLLILGLVVLTAGAEVLVRGAVGLAQAFKLSPLIIGLTVVAYGTSAPELAVSVKACYAGQAEIALGNAVGSNIFNILLILGLAAAIAPLTASRQLVRLDVPIMIGVSVILWALASDGILERVNGFVLVSGLVVYTGVLIVLGRREDKSDVPIEHPKLQSESPTKPRLGLASLMIIMGLALLVIGARWLVQGAVLVAQSLGVSDLLISLTIIAAGTSMPELATSIVASIRGQRDIAIGNVVGSNIFNVLCVLGVSSIVAPSGLDVADSAIQFDIPIAIAAAFACLPIFLTGGRVSRAEGVLFLSYYAAYLIFLLLSATRHPALEGFSLAMLGFFLPLSMLGLAMSVMTWLLPKRVAR